MRKLILIGITLIFLFGCKKDENTKVASGFLNTIELKVGDCTESLDGSYICFQSVINDSRCPVGAICIWEGNAVIAVDVWKGFKKHGIRLNTNAGFQTDTSIGNLYVSLM